MRGGARWFPQTVFPSRRLSPHPRFLPAPAPPPAPGALWPTCASRQQTNRGLVRDAIGHAQPPQPCSRHQRRDVPGWPYSGVTSCQLLPHQSHAVRRRLSTGPLLPPRRAHQQVQRSLRAHGRSDPTGESAAPSSRRLRRAFPAAQWPQPRPRRGAGTRRCLRL